MNRKGPWEGSPSPLPLRAHRRETSGYEAVPGDNSSCDNEHLAFHQL